MSSGEESHRADPEQRPAEGPTGGSAGSGAAGDARRRLSAGAAATLAVWVALVAVLAVLAVGVGGSLSPSVIVTPGTGSAEAQRMAEDRFGPSQLMPILLQGPKLSLERQGPGLVQALAQRPHTRVLSPWNAPAGTEGLRRSPTAAIVLVSVDRTEQQAIESDQPAIEALLAKRVASPVHAYLTGQPSIDAAMREQALSTARRDGLIAAAVLGVLLLIGLRSPAAAIVELLAGASAIAALGLIRLLGEQISIDPLSVPLAAMSGLALGAAWSLIVLDRYRREMRMGGAPSGAAMAAVRSAGAGVLLAGSGLILALLITAAIAPTKLFVSLGIGVVLASLTALSAALIALPATLSLLGERAIVALAAPASLTAAWERLTAAGGAARRHPGLSGAIAIVALLLLALPALGLKAGQPGVYQLPEGNPARVSFEKVAAVMGPGWPTPYDVVLSNPHGPITTATMLAELDGLQAQIAGTPAVASVSGPGSLSEQTKPLGKLPGALKESGKLLTGGKKDLGRLLSGLGEAGAGAKELQGGLQEAASGAGELHAGSGAAQSGASQLHAGLATAQGGSAQLESGLQQALDGARALKDGATEALAGSVDLVNGISSVRTPVTAGLPSTERLKEVTAETAATIGSLQGQAEGAGTELQSALSALEGMSVGKSDPRYAEALAAVQSASSSVSEVSSGLGDAAPGAAEAAESAATLAVQTSFLDAALQQLQSGAGELQEGLAKLRAGNSELAKGIDQLAAGGGELTSGLTQLRDGAAELEAGLGLLTNGSGELQEGLQSGVAPVGELVTGLGLLRDGVAQFAGQLPSPKDLEDLQRQSPDLFKSGYFLLAAVDGAPPSASNAASFTINIERGGDAGEIAVISKYPSGDARTVQLGEDLRGQVRRFAKANGLQAAVGGPAGNLVDLTSSVKDSLPWVIAGVAVATLLLLALSLRALLVPLLSVVLQLLGVAAAFGVLTLMFGVSAPPFGGPGHIDYVTIVGAFSIAFGVMLLFQALPLVLVFRELRAGGPGAQATQRRGEADAGRRGGLVAPAMQRALESTSAASAGAAILLLGALIPFASSDMIALRELAAGVALAVLAGALLLRPLLLPAGMRMLGIAGWWPGCAGLRSEEQQGATTADEQTIPMDGGQGDPTVGFVHRVLRPKKGREKE